MKRSSAPATLGLPLLACLALGAAHMSCGEPAPCVQSPGLPSASAAPSATTGVPPAKGPTAAEAETFLNEVNQKLLGLWATRDLAGWAYQTNLSPDTSALADRTEAATAAYVTEAVLASRKFAGAADLLPTQKRQLHLLTLSQIIPAPTDAQLRDELAKLQSEMQGAYGAGSYCPHKVPGSALLRTTEKESRAKVDKKQCLKLDDLERILRTSRKPDELKEAWEGWHEIAKPMRPKYARYVELANQGAKELGFADVGQIWRAGYDMSVAEFEQDTERLWSEVKPLYDELHCHVRAKLRQKYGTKVVPERAPIPAHLLGNMWAQEWFIDDLVTPFPKEPSINVDKALAAKRMKPEAMVKIGEDFFTGLGFDKLPDTFWTRSMFTRPKGREVVCHASAWDVQWNGDLRIKMCIEPTESDLVTIHHELGHIFYYQRYHKLPALFQGAANDGFHEAVGDALALSVTPEYLKNLGLLNKLPTGDKGRLNHQMKMALDKVAFLPFGYVIDKWRWDVLSGKIAPSEYNARWWELRRKYQGVLPASPRGEEYFDPGAKYHIPASTPYIRYFLARIYQFQFHKALCTLAGHKGPLDSCSIHKNSAAGEKLREMMSMAASKPWQEAMAHLTGSRRGDAGPMLEYFEPLRVWLREQNRAEQCGY